MVENKVSDVYLAEKADINTYRLAWQEIRGLAYEPAESAALIRAIAAELPVVREGRERGWLAESLPR